MKSTKPVFYFLLAALIVLICAAISQQFFPQSIVWWQFFIAFFCFAIVGFAAVIIFIQSNALSITMPEIKRILLHYIGIAAVSLLISSFVFITEWIGWVKFTIIWLTYLLPAVLYGITYSNNKLAN